MRKSLLILLLSLMTLNSNAQMMKLGDLNHDNQVNITDIMTLVDIVMNGYSPFDVSPTEISMKAGATALLTIEGGYYYYEVESANPDVVTASLNDLTVTLTAIAGGETYVTVKDVLTFRNIIIPVVVEHNELQVSTNDLSLLPGQQGTVEINSGSGYYSVKSSDEGVATATVSGTTITVKAVDEGTANITITDIKTDETAVVEVSVSISENITCPDENHPHLIDLGLPSGTKWACCNVGAEKPEDCGGYYAWGEIEEKDYYYWSNYIHCDGSWEKCYYLGEDIAGTMYDVAQVKWGESWAMPSSEQQNELLKNSISQWTTINGVDGQIFTGPSGKTIFLPSAGIRWNDVTNSFYNPGNYGNYWSSQSLERYAITLYFKSDKTEMGYEYRGVGLPVRPVSALTFEELPLTLSASSFELHVGVKSNVEITSGSGNYSLTSSDMEVATAKFKGFSVIVTAVGTGTATITVTDTKSEETKTIEVTVKEFPMSYLSCPDSHHPHLIDLGLPSCTKWACCNVGAEKPEDFGGYYAWGETEEKTTYNWKNYIHCNGSSSTCYDIGDDIAGTQYDVAHVKWGDYWVMPSYSQINELLNNCTYTWTYGAEGGIFTSKNNGGSIFLPFSRYRWNDRLYSEDDGLGYIWSSTKAFLDEAYSLFFMNWDGVREVGNYERYYGLCVRPVFQ